MKGTLKQGNIKGLISINGTDNTRGNLLVIYGLVHQTSTFTSHENTAMSAAMLCLMAVGVFDTTNKVGMCDTKVYYVTR